MSRPTNKSSQKVNELSTNFQCSLLLFNQLSKESTNFQQICNISQYLSTNLHKVFNEFSTNFQYFSIFFNKLLSFLSFSIVFSLLCSLVLSFRGSLLRSLFLSCALFFLDVQTDQQIFTKSQRTFNKFSVFFNNFQQAFKRSNEFSTNLQYFLLFFTKSSTNSQHIFNISQYFSTNFQEDFNIFSIFFYILQQVFTRSSMNLQQSFNILLLNILQQILTKYSANFQQMFNIVFQYSSTNFQHFFKQNCNIVLISFHKVSTKFSTNFQQIFNSFF